MLVLFILGLALTNECLALICFKCEDFRNARQVCNPSLQTCTGTRCILAFLDNATNFLADCYTVSTSVDDFCWTDDNNRTLCSCKTQFCNSPISTDHLKRSATNLLPDLLIDTMLRPTSFTTGRTTSIIGGFSMTSPGYSSGNIGSSSFSPVFSLMPAEASTSTSTIPIMLTATSSEGISSSTIPTAAYFLSTTADIVTTTKISFSVFSALISISLVSLLIL